MPAGVRLVGDEVHLAIRRRQARLFGDDVLRREQVHIRGQKIIIAREWFEGDDKSIGPDDVRCDERIMTEIRARIDDEGSAPQMFHEEFRLGGLPITAPEDDARQRTLLRMYPSAVMRQAHYEGPTRAEQIEEDTPEPCQQFVTADLLGRKAPRDSGEKCISQVSLPGNVPEPPRQ